MLGANHDAVIILDNGPLVKSFLVPDIGQVRRATILQRHLKLKEESQG